MSGELRLVLSVSAALTLGWLYSAPPFYLKRSPAGLAATAIPGGLLTYYAGYVAGGGDHENIVPLIVFAVIMSLWMGLVGQTKDLSDVAGDKKAGRKSGPIAWGEDASRLVLSIVALSLGAGYVVMAFVIESALLGSAVVLMIGATAVALLTLGVPHDGDRAERRTPYRAFMFTQYLAHLAILI